MLLAIDIGNTDTVLGVFDGENLATQMRLSTLLVHEPAKVWEPIRSFFLTNNITLSLLSGVGISSVVPNSTTIFKTIAREYLRLEPIIVNGSLNLGIKIHYKDPIALGADRLCNVVAGYKKYGGPLIVIDFGTATTFDVVAKNGDFLGGAIMLGLLSTASELHRRTAQLPNIELLFPDHIIGTDTVSSIQSGVMFSSIDAVEGMVRRIWKELGTRTRVIATGGLSTIIAKRTAIIDACETSLVLEGVRLIWERVNSIDNEQ
jgi:type III pantothenate kinase